MKCVPSRSRLMEDRTANIMTAMNGQINSRVSSWKQLEETSWKINTFEKEKNNFIRSSFVLNVQQFLQKRICGISEYEWSVSGGDTNRNFHPTNCRPSEMRTLVRPLSLNRAYTCADYILSGSSSVKETLPLEKHKLYLISTAHIDYSIENGCCLTSEVRRQNYEWHSSALRGFIHWTDPE